MAPGRTIPGFNRDEYVQLLTALPPVKIRTQAQASAIDQQIEILMVRPDLTAAERAYIDLLSDLLADWEDVTAPVPDVYGVELVHALLEERGLHQNDLVSVFTTELAVAEVLTKRRELTYQHIASLARFFQVPPAAFFPRS